MVDEIKPQFPDDSSRRNPSSIVPAQTAVGHPGFDYETEKQLTTGEILHGFAERRHFIGVLKRARILFDPKSLPGVTPTESLDFLIKGLQLGDPDKLRQILIPNETVAQNIRENFSEFIEYMNRQNNERTVAEIWMAVDADPFTKMALQWEIQTPKQFNDDYIEKHAGPVAADLRKLDKLLKNLNGTEILIQIDDDSEGVHFIGLTTADGRSIDFAQSMDPNSPYRDVVLGGQAASTEDRGYEPKNISVDGRLRIPFEAREVLLTKDSEDWDLSARLLESKFWRIGKYNVPFNPDNNFPGFIIGEELTRQRKDDGGLKITFNVLKKAMDKSRS